MINIHTSGKYVGRGNTTIVDERNRKMNMHRDRSHISEDSYADPGLGWIDAQEICNQLWEYHESTRDVFRAEFMFFNAPELGYKPDRKVGYALSGPVKKTVWP